MRPRIGITWATQPGSVRKSFEAALESKIPFRPRRITLSSANILIVPPAASPENGARPPLPPSEEAATLRVGVISTQW